MKFVVVIGIAPSEGLRYPPRTPTQFLSAPNSNLQAVDKLRVLPIGKIIEFLALDLDITWLRPNGSLLLVLVLAPPIDKQDVQQRHNPAYDDRDLGGAVFGSVLGLEDLGTDDVAHAVPDQIHGCHCRLLRPAGNVGRDEGE